MEVRHDGRFNTTERRCIRSTTVRFSGTGTASEPVFRLPSSMGAAEKP